MSDPGWILPRRPPALESRGDCDAVIAGMSITDARKEKYDFSPYYDSGVGMAVLWTPISIPTKLKVTNVAAKIGTEGCTFAGVHRRQVRLP